MSHPLCLAVLHGASSVSKREARWSYREFCDVEIPEIPERYRWEKAGGGNGIIELALDHNRGTNTDIPSLASPGV